MRLYREVATGLLAGAVAGALILGIAGRAATAGVALLTGNALNLSPRGLLEVVIAGTLAGGIGGILLLALRRVHRGSSVTRGITVGAVLFVCSILLARTVGKIFLSASSMQLLTLGVVAIMFVVYGFYADALLTRFEGNDGKTASRHGE